MTAARAPRPVQGPATPRPRRLQPVTRRHAVLDRLRTALNLSDQALARLLGLDPHTPHECRRTGNVPHRAIIAAAQSGVLDVDLHWLFTGQLPPSRRAP